MKRIWRTIAVALAACFLALCAGCSPSGSAGAGATVGLAPGSYTASVTLVGGSGKASVASPAMLEVAEDGSATATVVWSSSNYDQMVVDGVQYLPVSTEGGSTFVIPVAALDADLPVQAETTAMSQPHVIDYMLRFTLDGAGEAGGDGAGGLREAAPEGTVADFHNPDLGNGWEVAKEMPLEHATQFTVDYYEGGYALLCLSDGARYLLVPAGKTVPEGIAEDIVALQQPIRDVYLAASDAMCLFDALDALDAITVSGISRDNWAVPAAVEAMDAGRIAYGGKYSMPDYDTLLAKECRLAIESTMINHTPEVRDKLIELGIPVFTERSSYEAEPLGRAEWVKLYGAMLGEEDAASRLFDVQARKVQAIDTANTGKTVAYFYINSNGAAVVRKPGDYVTKMISLAGGEYVFQSLADDGVAASAVTLEMERFFAEAKDADVIIYNATIDAGVQTLDDLLAKNSLLGKFKAVQEGEVWITKQNMYQQMMSTGDIISDFNKVLRGEEEGLTYVRRLRSG